jgi:hypothetical protein
MPQNEPTGHVTSAVDAEGPPRFEEADEDNAQWPEESEELPRRPRRRLLTPISMALVAALLVAVGFIAGVRMEKGQTTSSSSAGAGGGQEARFAALKGGQSGPGAVPGAAAAGPPTGFPGSGGSASGTLTTGEVSYVRGGTLYVANGQGNTVKVTASTGAKVTKTVTTKVPNINPGDTVIVQGSQGTKGSITASSISVSTSATGSSSSGSGASSSGDSGASALFGSGG